MPRNLFSVLALTVGSAFATWIWAEDASAPSTQELRELRQAVQQQPKQIELLTEQGGKLTRPVEAQKVAEAGARGAESGAAAARTTTIENASASRGPDGTT